MNRRRGEDRMVCPGCETSFHPLDPYWSKVRGTVAIYYCSAVCADADRRRGDSIVGPT